MGEPGPAAEESFSDSETFERGTGVREKGAARSATWAAAVDDDLDIDIGDEGAEESDLEPSEVRASLATAYSSANSQVLDPQLINETIARYEYLLEDPSSPFLSNFVALLDYQDGRDFMTLEKFYEEYGEIDASSPQHVQMRHPLRSCLRQTEKLKTLCQELARMQATAIDM